MRLEAFLEARRSRWQRLEDLVRLGKRRGLGSLSGDELLELGELYRAATSDLAVARRDFPHDRVAAYLNGLVAQAHPVVYQEPGTSLNRVGTFARYGFPEAWRRSEMYIAAAFGIFALAAIVSAVLVVWRLSMADILLPGTAGMARSYMQQHQLWVKNAAANSPVTSNFIMTNNIQVAFVCFAGGILVGVPTVYELVQNGIMVGTLGAMAAHYGVSDQLWSFIAPHGVIELSVIFMAGGAGLMLGDAVLRPGLLRRRDAVPRAARLSLQLVAGGIPLLMIAGTIEGFFSPSDAPDALKLAVSAFTGVVLYSYLLASRRPLRRQRYVLQDAMADGGPAA